MTTSKPDLRALEAREALSVVGTLPLSVDWMYSAIRHCQRNLDFDAEDGGNEPDRQAGSAIAKIINATPTLLDERDALAARIAELEAGLLATADALDCAVGREPDSHDWHPEHSLCVAWRAVKSARLLLTAEKGERA